MNLSRFYDEEADDVRWDELKQTVQYATRFLDNVIDTTPYFFEENRDIQQSERRVGLGTMGIAELMVKLGIRYGSPESIEFIDEVYRFIAPRSLHHINRASAGKRRVPQVRRREIPRKRLHARDG